MAIDYRMTRIKYPSRPSQQHFLYPECVGERQWETRIFSMPESHMSQRQISTIRVLLASKRYSPRQLTQLMKINKGDPTNKGLGGREANINSKHFHATWKLRNSSSDINKVLSGTSEYTIGVPPSNATRRKPAQQVRRKTLKDKRKR